MADPQRVPTRFVGVTLDEVRAAGSGLYEVTTTDGVRVRLHDMSLTRLVHDVAAGALVIEFLYDKPTWTPPEAESTPLAKFSFEDVVVLEQEDEPVEPDDPPEALGQVDFFHYNERSGVLTLSTWTTFWEFTASVVTLSMHSSR